MFYPFLSLPAIYFFACQPYISLLAYADVLAISLPASLIFLCLPALYFFACLG
jgi:hypothetical protein